MSGLFITFEGTEGSGKSTQLQRLADHIRAVSPRTVRVLREPGGTPIGEEIRHTLKHSSVNQAMTPETELLLVNASRAQLVREVIRPALQAGEIVLCDRYHDSTLAYQGYGRGLDLTRVRGIVDFAIEDTKPDLTLLFVVPAAVSQARRLERQAGSPPQRDRFEEAGREFFCRVEAGYREIAAADPQRIKVIEASGELEAVERAVWLRIEPLVAVAGAPR